MERVPLAVPGDQAAGHQPFAVALANYMNNVAGRATNPDGANMAGGVLLAIPPVVLFLIFQNTSPLRTSGPVSRAEREEPDEPA